MAKKSAKSDRQAVIEQIRKKQRSADQRRGFMIVGVCAVIALLIVGAAAFKPIKDWWDVRQFNGKNLAAIGAPAGVCGKVTEKTATGNQQHVPTGQTVDYKDAPPAFGARSPIERAVIAFIHPHLLFSEQDLLEKNQFKMEYIPFDWSLNDLTGRGGR